MKYDNETFIKKSNLIHNYKFDYSKTKYINSRCKVIITCPVHGDFIQNSAAHLRGQDCKKCFSDRIRAKNIEEKFNKIHDYKYDYSLMVYKNNKTEIIINCKKCGNIFKMRPDIHLKCGCPRCATELKADKFKEKKFIEKAKIIHCDNFDYTRVEYKNNRTPVLIFCKKCKSFFKQKPYSHLKGNGCNNCKESHGEKYIKNILEYKKIKYIQQKKFKNCKYLRELPFDFYLPELNVCIEYDGKQHFEIIDFWGGKNGLILRKEKDDIKNNYCLENNIKLIRIKFDEDINEKLTLLYD